MDHYGGGNRQKLSTDIYHNKYICRTKKHRDTIKKRTEDKITITKRATGNWNCQNWRTVRYIEDGGKIVCIKRGKKNFCVNSKYYLPTKSLQFPTPRKTKYNTP